MGNLSKYSGGYTLESVQSEVSAIAAGSGNDVIKLQLGENVYRVLPPINGTGSPFVITHRHFAKLPGLQRPAVFNCPRIMAKRACEVCAIKSKLESSGDPADAKVAEDLGAPMAAYCNVIDRNNKDPYPQKLSFGKSVHSQLVEIRSDAKNGGDFTNPDDDGFDVIITRTGTGRTDTKYKVIAARKSTPLHADETQAIDWIESQPDLLALTRVPSEYEIRNMLSGVDRNLGAGGTPTVIGRRLPPAQAGPKRRTAADDIEEEDEEETSAN